MILKLEQLQCAGFVQGPRRVRQPPAQGRAAGRGGGRVWRQPRRRRRVRRAPARHPGQDLRADRVLPAKIERIRQLADLVIAGDRYADALEAAEQWIATSGAMSVHAYDQRETILGQATLALELDDQAGPLDTVLVPVGGGGLIAGIASYFAGSARVIGVEPDGAPPSSAPGRQARPSTRRRAASPSTPSPRAASATWSSRSPRPTWRTWCWWTMTPSAARSARSGRPRASRPAGRLGRRRGPARGRVQARAGRARRRHHQRRQHGPVPAGRRSNPAVSPRRSVIVGTWTTTRSCFAVSYQGVTPGVPVLTRDGSSSASLSTCSRCPRRTSSRDRGVDRRWRLA